MKAKRPFRAMLACLACSVLLQQALMVPGISGLNRPETVELPDVKPGAPGSFSDLMHRRRSIRTFGQGSMTLDQVAKIVFAAQGSTRRGMYRTVPSAGGLYPLEVFIVAGPVKGLGPGVYKYRPEGHELEIIASGDHRKELAQQLYGQTWVAEAQTVVVICAVYERVTGKYGQRGVRYTHIEAGCAAQNISLEGINLGLGSTVVGAFSDREVGKVLKADEDEVPLIVMPVGLMD